ncbi:3-hydroxybutyrate dehydrogenase [Planosporangium thailandense]|uniref:3-hydroxybutyrate dehydrogenase n=1 Tax=Planosporangium thailandense TaxID=765197 RepID=A0ABX0Y387_9ACTN|nr:3-hydroxybutyrate dehydrogenase [Planosporangium thailandense]NJC72592.1 3-hydroxybutyrate dehydrogenase [Planosporangium thailandense]
MAVQVDLTGRTALVTGAGSGIGRACAVRLAGAGATVVALDRDETGLKEVAREADVRAVVADLSDLDAVDALDLGAGTVDILVNNAGFQHVAPIEEFPPEVFTAMLRVMLEAPFRLARRCLPGMYANGWGRVVNISSVHGVRASAFKSAYVTAKHGLEGFSKVIALEGAAHGVTSHCINPAYVRTPLVERQIEAQAATNGIAPDEVVEKVMLAPAAIKRLVEPAEVADLVVYLCSPEASFMTGESIMMDGGWTAH